ncbi:MAG: hypothetical protein JNM52_07650 [Betaproteobacteria bacterium]|nr:hypothetical protein [Betaproteobacteria bacterium]
MKNEKMKVDIDNQTEKLEFTPAMLVRLRELVSGGVEGDALAETGATQWYKEVATVWKRVGR